jgi:signal-transduction protein with cAMP-binding, CBS, and nucleotidyltransferase domain
VAEKFEGKTCLNLKDCLRPIEIFCRLYALQFDIREVSTIERLRQLYEHGLFDVETLREMVYLFDHIWNLRFMNQLVEYTDLRQVNDVLAIDDLTTIEQQNLANVLNRIQQLQTLAKQDFH